MGPDRYTSQDLAQDPFVQHFSLSELVVEGVINSSATISVDSNFEPNPSARTLRSDLNSSYPIHPVFHRKLWKLDHPAQDWKILDPVLRLASCYLDDPWILPFFNGLLDEQRTTWEDLGDAKNEARFEQKLWTFDQLCGQNAAICREQQANTWKKIGAMQNYVTWCFELRAGYGFTSPDTSPRGKITPRTRKSVIRIHPDYMRVLRGQIQARQYPGTSNFNAESALLRTRLHMAMDLCHELVHAIGYAYLGRNDDEWVGRPWGKKLPAEPFFRKGRISELGWAFQQYAFGGLVNPIGSFTREGGVACPYGMWLQEFPGTKSKPDQRFSLFERGGPKDEPWGLTLERRDAVKMQYVEKQLTRQFWEKDMLVHWKNLQVGSADQCLTITRKL